MPGFELNHVGKMGHRERQGFVYPTKQINTTITGDMATNGARTSAAMVVI